MKRLHPFVLPTALSLSVLLACTQTKVIEQVDPSLAPDGGAAQQPGGPTEDPLVDLSPDWKSKAGSYLNGSSEKWLAGPPQVGQNTDCAMSCHTTAAALLASKALGGIAAATEARAAFEARVAEAKAGKAVPFYGESGDAKTKESHATEAVLNALTLSFDDLGGGGTISASTKAALEDMWSKQNSSGSWDWLEFGLEPWETRNDWGAAMAALVAGSIPENTTSGQAAGTAKVKAYIKENVGSMALHDRAAVLWANGSLVGLLDEAEATQIADALVEQQQEDGGFSILTWGKGELAKSTGKSDGYATSLAVLALCKGTPNGMQRPEVFKGLKWLAANQAANGSWPGQSLNSTTARAKGFMTDAATAYAALAITTCAPKK